MCRVRPASATEGAACVHVPSETEVVVTQGGRDGRRAFTFDHVFGTQSGQADVFEEVEPVLESVLGGFNVCIFAYGQTGSGKTFTMEGKRDDESLAGINPRALRELFKMLEERRRLENLGSDKGEGRWEYEVSVSYLEIYNENLRDLLAPATSNPNANPNAKKGGLDVRSLPGVPVEVPGLTVASVECMEEVEDALASGGARRSVSATKMNATSSRSHSIFSVTVNGRHSGTGQTTHGKLHLVDLAGSERVKKSEVSGQGMAEAQHINKSLSALGDVMAALQEKSKHIPFRNSKLTQLLADSLGGNSKTFMFVNINPSADAGPESLCSLNFAARVRRVELGKARGATSSGASLAELKAARADAERAQAELRAAQAKLIESERRLEAEAEARRSVEIEKSELESERCELERQQHEVSESMRSAHAEATRAHADAASQGEAKQREELERLRRELEAERKKSREAQGSARAAREEPQRRSAGEEATRPAATQPAAAAAAAARPSWRGAAADRHGDLAPPPVATAPVSLARASSGAAAPTANSLLDGPPQFTDAPSFFDSLIDECSAPILQPGGGGGGGGGLLQPMQPGAPANALQPLATVAEAPPSGAPPGSESKRRRTSPRLAAMASAAAAEPSSGTPAKRWTPAKLALSSQKAEVAREAARSARKVQFCCDADAAPEAAAAGRDECGAGGGAAASVPAFRLPALEKENGSFGANAATEEQPVPIKSALRKRPAPPAAAARPLSLEPMAAPLKSTAPRSVFSGALGGGAVRALVGGARRQPRASLGGAGGGSSIAKPRAGSMSSRRTSSIAAHMSRTASASQTQRRMTTH